jgi:hypothetical protein
LKSPVPAKVSFARYPLYDVTLRESAKTVSLSNSSSSLHTSCLPSVQSYFNILIHVQSSFGPVSTSVLKDLH